MNKLINEKLQNVSQLKLFHTNNVSVFETFLASSPAHKYLRNVHAISEAKCESAKLFKISDFVNNSKKIIQKKVILLC